MIPLKSVKYFLVFAHNYTVLRYTPLPWTVTVELWRSHLPPNLVTRLGKQRTAGSHSPLFLASQILHSLLSVAATNSRDEPSWLVACSVWNLNWQHIAPAPAFSVEREWVVTQWVTQWVSKWASTAHWSYCGCTLGLPYMLKQLLGSSPMEIF